MAGGFFVVTEGKEDEMVIVMAPEVTQARYRLGSGPGQRSAGGEAFVSRGVSRTIIGLVGDVDHFGALNLRS